MKTLPPGRGSITYDDQGDADRPVTLLWPGLFSDHRMWDAQVDALGSAARRTLALDPPGHGRSPEPNRISSMDESTVIALPLIDVLPADLPVLMLAPRRAA